MTTPTNPQELVALLRAQHRALGAGLTHALESAKANTATTGEEVVKYLETFKGNLVEHLNLENGVFYPDYIGKKNAIKEDVAYTQEFIKKMSDIAVAVTAFLEKYNTPHAVAMSREVFITELTGIIDTLNMRIETEEEIFNMYLLM